MIDSTLIAGVLTATAAIAAAVIGVRETRKRDSVGSEGLRAEGSLHISDVLVSQEGETCLLDFRVYNEGGSDVIINHVKLEVLDVGTVRVRAFMEFSKTYDLDISQLEEVGDAIECSTSQVIKPGEADRFGITLIAKELGDGVFKGWKILPTLYTNFGRVHGKPVEVWLPDHLEGYKIEQAKALTELHERLMSGEITTAEAREEELQIEWRYKEESEVREVVERVLSRYRNGLITHDEASEHLQWIQRTLDELPDSAQITEDKASELMQWIQGRLQELQTGRDSEE